MDLIDRQAAINALNKHVIYSDDGEQEINTDCVFHTLESLPSAEPHWIPVSERLPAEAYPVIVTWKNDDPAWYYQYILGKHYVGVAHYKNGKWYWYSSITEDVLMEYGRYDSEEFDEAIKVVAWMPLPEPASMEV